MRVLTVAALGMGIILTLAPALLRTWIGPATSSDIWVPGSRYTISAILLIDAIAIAGVDAFLRRPNISLRRARRATVVLLLVIGLSLGWSTGFRYPNLRSGNAPWPRTHAGLAHNHDAGRTVVTDPAVTNVPLAGLTARAAAGT